MALELVLDTVDSIVVGAGVVGLAVAAALARTGREVVVLEAAANFGGGISSRNSGVIHAGIYYPTGSLKARLCVEGRERVYAYCAQRQVPFQRLGKHIVAASAAEIRVLEQLMAQARANGVEDLAWLNDEELRRAEPAVRGIAALFSPSTGIVDTHGLMGALIGELEDAGGAVAYRSPFEGAEPMGTLHSVRVGGDQPFVLGCREVVNAAGLAASRVAEAIITGEPVPTPRTLYARGCYFELARGATPFRSLIYPVPEPGGLGVHATLDLGGRVRFGPDVEWIDEPDYRVAPERAEAFYSRIRAYWPGLPDGALAPGYAGVRPKLKSQDGSAADFLIRRRGAGVVDLLGIESPGLTSSLAIADHVLALMDAA